MIPVMALPYIISSNEITSHLFSALDILDFLFTFKLIVWLLVDA